MRTILGLFFFGHAVAHLPGFLVDLRLKTLPELPYRTTVLGGLIDLGDIGTKAMGWAWLSAAIALGVVAVATGLGAAWWRSAAYAAVALSVVLCLLALPDTRYGLLANLVLVLILVLSSRVVAHAT